ncbi:MAG: hypothetical protein J0M19_16500, partial [Sphingomonadales bacterium]|nr:hypothetical protein [Sphingomonadales bacterium]
MRKQPLLFCLLLALTACGSGTGENKTGAVAAGDMAANLPMGVPLMPGATVKSNNNGAAGAGQTNAAAILTSAEPVEAVFDYYTGAMEDAGFGASRETAAGEIRTVTATRDGEMGMITVKPDGGATTVMIVSR